MSWFLESKGRRYPIESEASIGRDRDASIRVDDDQVSRRHAVMRLLDGALVLEDLRSRNGTFVNGQRIAGLVQLAAGDRVRVGGVELEVVQRVATAPIEPEDVTKPMPNIEAGMTLPPDGPLAVLSPREREVFALLARGTAQREIAAQFGVSVKTIETHRTRIGQKLGLRTRAELISYALEAGVLRPDSQR